MESFQKSRKSRKLKNPKISPANYLPDRPPFLCQITSFANRGVVVIAQEWVRLVPEPIEIIGLYQSKPGGSHLEAISRGAKIVWPGSEPKRGAAMEHVDVHTGRGRKVQGEFLKARWSTWLPWPASRRASPLCAWSPQWSEGETSGLNVEYL